jgi:hypothetical protein
VFGVVSFFGEVDFESVELSGVEGLAEGGHPHLGVALRDVLGEGEKGADVFPVAFDEGAAESAFMVFAVAGGAVFGIELVDFPVALLVLCMECKKGQDCEAEGANDAHGWGIVRMERRIAIRGTVLMLLGWR